MNSIQSLAKTISSYIDMYDDEKLSPEEATIVIDTRTIILESMAIPMDEKLSKKKEKKMIKKLDESFSKVISIFSEAKKPNAEILETIKAKRDGKKNKQTATEELEEKKVTRTSSRKKKSSESSESSKFDSAFPDALMDIFAKRIDEIGNDQDYMNTGMIAVLETMAKMAKEMEMLKDKMDLADAIKKKKKWD